MIELILNLISAGLLAAVAFLFLLVRLASLGSGFLYKAACRWDHRYAWC